MVDNGQLTLAGGGGGGEGDGGEKRASPQSLLSRNRSGNREGDAGRASGLAASGGARALALARLRQCLRTMRRQSANASTPGSRNLVAIVSCPLLSSKQTVRVARPRRKVKGKSDTPPEKGTIAIGRERRLFARVNECVFVCLYKLPQNCFQAPPSPTHTHRHK